MAFSVKNIPDLTGKVALVTGASSGLGYCTAEYLAANGAKVWLAARNEDRTRAAIAQIEAFHPQVKGKNLLHFLHLDFESSKGAKDTGERFLALETRLDILVNNAGIQPVEAKTNSEGIMETMSVNHICHFILGQTVRPLLEYTARLPGSDVRIVTVASEAQDYAHPKLTFNTYEELVNPIVPTDTGSRFELVSKSRMGLYGASKLANTLYTNELQRQFLSSGLPIIAISLHPGLVGTAGVLDLAPWLVRVILRPFIRTPLDGATSILFAATSLEVKKKPTMYQGSYLYPVGKLHSLDGKPGGNIELARSLWRTTEEAVGRLLGE